MTKQSRRLLLLLALFCLSSSIAFATRVERLIDPWQPKHYAVSLTLNDQLSEIVAAKARIDVAVLKKTSVIDLDFGDMKTIGVTVDAKRAEFTHRNGKLEIKIAEFANAGTNIAIEVVYQGKPKDGLILTKDKDGQPSVVGDNWPNRVHHWIPSFDHPSAKATVTFNITAAAREEVVANGKLQNVQPTADGNRTWTYSEGVPIPPYCMIIGVGQFARVEPAQRALTPLSYYEPQSEKHLAEKGFSPTIPSLEFF